MNNFIYNIVDIVERRVLDMYFHLGKGAAVREKEIIGVFDMENTTVTAKSRIFLEKSQARGEILETDFDLPKSYAICSGKRNKGKKSERKNRVLLSSLSPASLLKKSVHADE